MFISFLGLGQAGSSITDLAAKEGFYSACMNFSQMDLDSLEYVPNRLKLVGSEGIGKQRFNAIELMNDNWDLATNFIKDKFAHSTIEIVFVPFSTAGGSGSGIAPVLLNLLTELMPEKVFVACPIIPSSKEVVINQKNCLDTFEDLSQLDICILPIDNEKVRTTFNNVGRHSLYKLTNQGFISLIKKLRDYTNMDSKYGVLDKKDLKNIFDSKGIATISETVINKLNGNNELSEQGIAKVIQNSWNNGIFANIDLGQIIKAGIIYDGQEKLMDLIDTQEIFSVFSNKMPVGLYEGYYNNEKGSVISILTGLKWCNERLSEIDDTIENQSHNFDQIETDKHYKSRTNNLVSVMNKQEVKTKSVKDISDIINKFKR